MIFDNDQTLVDSLADITTAWTQWAVHYGISREEFVAVHGSTSRDLVAAMIDEPRRAEALAMINRLESEIASETVAMPGAAEAMAAIPVGRRAVATSAIRPVLDVRLRAAGLPSDGVHVTSNDVTRGKPDPEPFLLAARRLGVPARECLVCEDAEVGIRAARAAGMATLGVTTTTDAATLGADLVVKDLSDVRFVADDAGVLVELVA